MHSCTCMYLYYIVHVYCNAHGHDEIQGWYICERNTLQTFDSVNIQHCITNKWQQVWDIHVLQLEPLPLLGVNEVKSPGSVVGRGRAKLRKPIIAQEFCRMLHASVHVHIKKLMYPGLQAPRLVLWLQLSACNIEKLALALGVGPGNVASIMYGNKSSTQSPRLKSN